MKKKSYCLRNGICEAPTGIHWAAFIRRLTFLHSAAFYTFLPWIYLCFPFSQLPALFLSCSNIVSIDSSQSWRLLVCLFGFFFFKASRSVKRRETEGQGQESVTRKAETEAHEDTKEAIGCSAEG